MIKVLFDLNQYLPSGSWWNPALTSSLCVMLVILILALIVYFKAKKADPLQKPKGILLVAEIYVTKMDKMVEENMGPHVKKVGVPIFTFLYIYLFVGMIWGLTGMAAPFTYLFVPLSLGIYTFLQIHIISAYFTRWKYFKRYTSPFAIFLPINLISMWSPLLSLSFRLFGNALAGFVITSMVYNVFSNITIGSFSLGFIAMFVTPVLHAYFDVFSAYIQTTVYILLSMQLIGAEVPEDGKVQYSKRKLAKIKAKYNKQLSTTGEISPVVTNK
jgi:F-type H+-transporting ATPase subunit a